MRLAGFEEKSLKENEVGGEAEEGGSWKNLGKREKENSGWRTPIQSFQIQEKLQGKILDFWKCSRNNKSNDIQWNLTIKICQIWW
jgi:hypothetical protein